MSDAAFGLWPLVFLNTALFVVFLHEAARAGNLAITGPYRWVRHPQYDGFIPTLRSQPRIPAGRQ